MPVEPTILRRCTLLADAQTCSEAADMNAIFIGGLGLSTAFQCCCTSVLFLRWKILHACFKKLQTQRHLIYPGIVHNHGMSPHWCRTFFPHSLPVSFISANSMFPWSDYMEARGHAIACTGQWTFPQNKSTVSDSGCLFRLQWCPLKLPNPKIAACALC